MTRIEKQLHEWYPNRVMLQAEARTQHILLQVFMVREVQAVTMTLYETGDDGAPTDTEIGCELFLPAGKVTWDSLRKDLTDRFND